MCSGDEEEIDEKSAAQMLVLAHAYRVPWLKRRCEGAIGSRLTAESVVDTMQLAALCDAPQLHLRCTRLLAKEFKAVEKTEAWRFLQENDPWLELDILQRLHDADLVYIIIAVHQHGRILQEFHTKKIQTLNCALDVVWGIHVGRFCKWLCDTRFH